MSMENLSLDIEKVRPLPAEAEVGEPSGELDILLSVEPQSLMSSNLHRKMNVKQEVGYRMHRKMMKPAQKRLGFERIIKTQGWRTWRTVVAYLFSKGRLCAACSAPR